jgi:hypothetical protein
VLSSTSSSGLVARRLVVLSQRVCSTGDPEANVQPSSSSASSSSPSSSSFTSPSSLVARRPRVLVSRALKDPSEERTASDSSGANSDREPRAKPGRKRYAPLEAYGGEWTGENDGGVVVLTNNIHQRTYCFPQKTVLQAEEHITRSLSLDCAQQHCRCRNSMCLSNVAIANRSD